MKLNKWQKQGIIQAIKDDIPAINAETVATEIQAALFAAMAPEVRECYKLHPKAIRSEWTGVGDGTYQTYAIGDLKFNDVAKPWIDAEERRQKAIYAVAGVVNGCSTLKQLQAALPECIKYMPTEDAPSKNLPALANVVSDLVRLGWPKEKAAA